MTASLEGWSETARPEEGISACQGSQLSALQLELLTHAVPSSPMSPVG